MLICIADSEYFNIALKAYINEPNSKPLDIKEILCSERSPHNFPKA